MEILWHFLINQFLNATIKSYKKMLKLSNYHDAYLYMKMDSNPSDPDWALLYNRYHPFHEAYVSAYTSWKSAGGGQKGQTLSLNQMAKLLIKRVNKWDAMVQVVEGFEKGTANYMTLFPYGHYPFNTGAKASRINAVKVLSEALEPFALTEPAILAVKTLVDDFYTQLNDTRTKQQGSKGGTKQKSLDVENKRILAATEQYRNLGFLINKGADMPEQFAPFFELSVLRKHEQVRFTGTLDAGENEAVLIHSFADDDELVFSLTTDLPLAAGSEVAFYLASTPNGTDSTPVLVTVNKAKMTIEAADFGITNYGVHRYLTAVNNSIYELHYVVELN